MDNQRRNHPAVMFKYMYATIKQLIFPLIVFAFTSIKEWKLPLVFLGGSLVLGLVFFISFLNWKNFIFSIHENNLWVEKGIFTKNKKAIALDKITTINDNQGLIERVFDLVTLKIDTGSASVPGKKSNEVVLLLSMKEVEEVKKSLSNEQPQQFEKVDALTYTSTIRELFVYALTSNSIFAGLIFIISIYQVVKDLPTVDKIIEGSFIKIFKNTFEIPLTEMYFGKAVLVVLFMFTLYLLFSFMISIVRAIIKYYGFTVSREKEKLIISYGLFEKKTFSMPVKKIKAVYCKYGLIGSFFSLSSIHLESIGYGDEKGEIAILYPLLTEKKKEELINKLIPEFTFKEEFIKPPKKALKSFVLSTVLVPAILCTIFSVIIPYGYWSYILLIFLAFGGYRSYKNSGILKDQKNIVLCKGVVSRQIIILPIQAIQSTIESQNFLQKRNGLFNLSFSYQSNALGKRVGVRYMDETVRDIFFPVQLEAHSS